MADKYCEIQMLKDLEYKKACTAWISSGNAPNDFKAKIESRSGAIELPEEKASALDFQSVEFQEPQTPDSSLILDQLFEAKLVKLIPSEIAAFLLAIELGLKECRKNWDAASSSREAEYGLKLLYLLGASRNSKMSFKAEILRSVIARNDLSLAGIAKKYGYNRAEASKVARDFKEFLQLKTSTSTRNDAFVNQCKERANRVHKIKHADKIKSINK